MIALIGLLGFLAVCGVLLYAVAAIVVGVLSAAWELLCAPKRG